MRVKLLTAAALLAALCAWPLADAAGRGGSGAAEEPERPNIVVVMTDDQELMTEDGQRVWLRRKIMPRTFQFFTEGGTVFGSYIVTTPVCCPSRATVLTGQYGHNNGVLANKPGYVGLVEPDNVLPVWLRGAGYRTALIGKWMHGYADAVGDGALPAPGWGRWVELMNFDRYYGYDLSVDGARVHYGTGNNDYITTVLNKRALSWVREFVEGDRPLFMWLAHQAPHSAKALPNPCTRSALPDRRDYGLYRHERLPLPPNWGESDISDKPSYLQERPPIEAVEAGELRRKYRCRLASLRPVDRGMKELIATFRDAGELGDTVFVFTSDNGYFSGEHRLRSGKGLPYEEAIRVPFAIRVPRRFLGSGPPVPSVGLPVANIDLAPTILELAGVEPCTPDGGCRALDGRSLVPLIGGGTSWAQDRAIAIEQRNELPGLARRRDFGPCTYRGIRTPTVLYVETTSVLDPSSGECVAQPSPVIEHYDLSGDPYQLQNLFQASAGPTEQQAALAQRLASLSQCAGRPREPVPGRVPCE